MGRPQRIDFEGAWHHVMHRGAGRRIVFRDDAERRIFLRLLGELDERYHVEVHAFVLMGNHFHLLVRSADGRLSEAMQWLLSNFTRWLNARRQVDGAIFRGRFHGVPVLIEAHRHLLFRYLAENVRDLGQDVDPVTYPWSNLASVVDGSAATVHPWLHTDVLVQLYGTGAEALVAALRGPGGAHDAVAAAARILRNASTFTAGDAFSITQAAAQVACGLSDASERKARRISAGLWLLDATGRWSRRELGEVADATPSAVASAIHRLRAAAAADPAVLRFVQRVAELSAVDVLPAAA